MGSDITNALGMPKRDKRSQAQKDAIDAANAMKPVDYSSVPGATGKDSAGNPIGFGSQGVTNPNYAEYVKMHPDLMANYNLHWKAGAPQPLSGKNEGISLAEFGAMHWNSAGRNEGRTMPGVSGGGGEEAGYGGGLSGPAGGWFSPDNIYFPQLVQEYTRPAGNDYRNLFASYGFTGPLAQMEGAYEPGTVKGAALVPGGILEYQPPQIRTGLPTFIGNPYGSLQLPEDWESLLDLGEEEEEDDNKPTEGSGGGKGDKSGDPVGGALGTTSPAEQY